MSYTYKIPKNNDQRVYGHVNAYCIVQKRLNEEIKDSSIKLSASYWESVSESLKLVSKCWNNAKNKNDEDLRKQEVSFVYTPSKDMIPENCKLMLG
jgi:hypothetical protein